MVLVTPNPNRESSDEEWQKVVREAISVITSDDELFKPDEITTKKPPTPDNVKEIKAEKDLLNNKLKKEDSQGPTKQDASTITTFTKIDKKIFQ